MFGEAFGKETSHLTAQQFDPGIPVLYPVRHRTYSAVSPATAGSIIVVESQRRYPPRENIVNASPHNIFFRQQNTVVRRTILWRDLLHV